MDVDYTPAKSIVDLPISDPIHAPCPTMAGCEDFDPAKTKRGIFLLEKLREKHGLKKRDKRTSRANTMGYVCTSKGCIEPWGTVSNADSGNE